MFFSSNTPDSNGQLLSKLCKSLRSYQAPVELVISENDLASHLVNTVVLKPLGKTITSMHVMLHSGKVGNGTFPTSDSKKCTRTPLCTVGKIGEFTDRLHCDVSGQWRLIEDRPWMAKHNYKDYNIHLPLFPGYSKILVPPLHITLCYVKMPLSPCMKLFGEMNEMLPRCTIPSFIKSKEIRKVCLSVLCLVINQNNKQCIVISHFCCLHTLPTHWGRIWGIASVTFPTSQLPWMHRKCMHGVVLVWRHPAMTRFTWFSHHAPGWLSS